MDNNDKVLILPVENVLTLKFMDEGRGKSIRQKTTNIGGGGLALNNWTQLCENEWKTNNVLAIRLR